MRDAESASTGNGQNHFGIEAGQRHKDASTNALSESRIPHCVRSTNRQATDRIKKEAGTTKILAAPLDRYECWGGTQ